jgi:hypothetical protein
LTLERLTFQYVEGVEASTAADTSSLYAGEFSAPHCQNETSSESPSNELCQRYWSTFGYLRPLDCTTDVVAGLGRTQGGSLSYLRNCISAYGLRSENARYESLFTNIDSRPCYRHLLFFGRAALQIDTRSRSLSAEFCRSRQPWMGITRTLFSLASDENEAEIRSVELGAPK